MRRLHLGVLSGSVAMLALSLVLMGCGGSQEKKPAAGGGGGSPSKGGAKGGEKQAVEGKGKGVIRGKVTFTGDKAQLEKVTTELTKNLQEEMKKKDEAHCLAKDAPEWQKSEQTWRVGKNNNVGNVFVWIEPVDRNHYFPISEEQLKHAKDKADWPTIGQPHCVFVPHGVTVFAKYYDPKTKKLKDTEQELHVVNNAEISHNTKIEGGSTNSISGQTLPPKKEEDFKLSPAKEPVPVGCNIHPWMKAYAKVLDHPYAALSLADDKVKSDDPKFGTYEIKDVPAGAKVKIFAWHEKAGFVNKNGAKGDEVELKPETEVNFDIATIK